jgi:hypothetical protein
LFKPLIDGSSINLKELFSESCAEHGLNEYYYTQFKIHAMINDDFDIDLFTEDELNSIKKLYQYEILDTPAEQDYDTIASVAATIFGAKNAHISFIDGNHVFFKSMIDKTFEEDMIHISHLLIANGIEKEVVLDHENAQLPEKIKFYATAPIVGPEGDILGSIAVSDTQSHSLVTKLQLELLNGLSKVIAEKLEKRLSHLITIRSCNERLRMIAHDIKNPVTSISLYTQLLGSREMESAKVFSMAAKIATSVKRIEENLNNLPKKLQQ